MARDSYHNLEWTGFPGTAPQGLEMMFNKAYIRDQIKISRLSSLVEHGEPLDYFHRIIEAIGARHYTGLLTVSHEYGLSLTFLDNILERKATEFFKLDQMPRSCEISALRMILSPRAAEKNLVDLSGDRELGEQEVRLLYFTIFSALPGDILIEKIDETGLWRMFDYIWDKGLRKYFNSRYRAILEVPEEELTVLEIVDKVGLPALLDEAAVIRSYVEKRLADDSKLVDLKDKLALENSLKNEAIERLQQIRGSFENYPCDFKRLRKIMLEVALDLEVATIEKDGIGCLQDYIRGKGVLGAHEVALRYDFICPAVLESDMAQARRVIANSFFSQAHKTSKGKLFLRAEALYNLQSALKSGESYRLPGGYVLSVVRTVEGEEHYLFGRFSSRLEQDNFNILSLGYYYFFDSPTQAAAATVKYYLQSLAGDIRLGRALKKLLLALPIILGLSVLIGVLYYLTLGGTYESIAVGGGIGFIGVAIAFKNGYDEDVTPSSHERIPGYLARKGSKILATTVNFEAYPEEESRKME